MDNKKVSFDMSPPSVRVFSIYPTKVAHITSYTDISQQIRPQNVNTKTQVDGIKQKRTNNGVGTNTNGVGNQDDEILNEHAAGNNANTFNTSEAATFVAHSVGTCGYPPVVDTPIVSPAAFPTNKPVAATSGLKHVDRIIQSGIDDLSSENMHVAVVQHGNKSGVDANNLPKPFANMLKHERITKKINFCSLSNEENVVNSDVVLPKHAKEEVMSRYENTLVRYFVGKSIAFPLVQNYVNNTWIKFGLHKVMRTDNGVFLFKFSSSMGIDQVLE
ncbi:retrovirus-related pol polyprotein from transposon TNT 1-94 [Tanacetum coccineum]